MQLQENLLSDVGVAEAEVFFLFGLCGSLRGEEIWLVFLRELVGEELEDENLQQLQGKVRQQLLAALSLVLNDSVFRDHQQHNGVLQQAHVPEVSGQQAALQDAHRQLRALELLHDDPDRLLERAAPDSRRVRKSSLTREP